MTNRQTTPALEPPLGHPLFRHRDQNGNVIDDYHVCGCQPPSLLVGEREEPLDVERLTWTYSGECPKCGFAIEAELPSLRQTTPARPATQAGRRLLGDDDLYGPNADEVRRVILAIEAESHEEGMMRQLERQLHDEAATRPAPVALDVERRVLIEVARRCSDIDLRDAARAVLSVDEWLASPVVRTEDLPPCPICGKDDLFMGTDGKPGCPHCEVGVVLTSSVVHTEGSPE